MAASITTTPPSPLIVKIRKIREKRGKIRKTWSMTKKKKRSSEIFAAKMEKFFRKNVILVGEKKFPSPQFAPGFRHWLETTRIYRPLMLDSPRNKNCNK